MTILPAELISVAPSNVDSIPATTGPGEARVFGRTLNDLLESSDDNGPASIIGDCVNPQNDRACDVSSEPAHQVSSEPIVIVNANLNPTTFGEFDQLTLEMVQAGRSITGKVPGNIEMQLDTFSKTSVLELGKVDRLGLGVALLPEGATALESAQGVGQIEQSTASFIATPIRSEATGVSARGLESTTRGLQSEPQQLAVGLTTYVRVLKSQAGGEVKINLHPAELGRMSITVVTEGADTRVAFVVETQQARLAVESALPRLRDMMDDAGLSLADSDVSEQHQNDHARDHNNAPNGAPGTASNDVESPLESTTLSVALDPSRLVDTYI